MEGLESERGCAVWCKIPKKSIKNCVKKIVKRGMRSSLLWICEWTILALFSAPSIIPEPLVGQKI